MNNKCVVVTGTVIPNISIHGHENLDAATRQNEYEDITVRRNRYIETLSVYASILNAPIFFLENSSYDFSKDIEFQNLFQKTNITLVKFPKSQFVERGKGFQEFEMIDEFVKSISGRYRAFLKLSGRYQYRNIKSLMDTQTDGLLIDMLRRWQVAITSIFFTTVDFYEEHLMDLYLEADDRQGAWIERRLYQKLSGKVFPQRVQLFPIEPDLRDWTRSSADKAGSAIARLKQPVRNVERAILRRFGINELYLSWDHRSQTILRR